MTREEKSLLLKELCARLPYDTLYADIIWEDGYASNASFINTSVIRDLICDEIKSVKPYLRSMSSMTQEECRELRWIIATEPLWAMFDFFYSHHIDFRDLIPMGLAIEAPEGMYKTE